MSIPDFTFCTKGSYCSEQQATIVGKDNKKIFHKTVTTLTGQGPAYSGSETKIYIIKPNAAKVDEWVLVATTKDGGKTHTFTNAAVADLKQSLAPGGNLNKNTKAQVQKTLEIGGHNQGPISLPGTSGSLDKINPQQQKALGIVPSSTDTTGIGSTNIDENALQNFINSEQIKNERNGTRNQFPGFKENGPLIYPDGLASTYQDIIKFNMLKYTPSKFDKEKFGFSKEKRNLIEDTIGTVILPIPAGISDSNNVSWNDGQINALEAGLASVAITGIESGLEAGGSELINQLDKIKSNAGDAGTALKAALAGNAAGVPGLLTRTTGAIINQNLELLFNQPTLRPFSFTFKLSARGKSEAKKIIQIIRFFKQGMSPIRTESNLFLKSPHTFKIRYMQRSGDNKSKEHPYIGQIKECALESFNVDYTPEGQYATFSDGIMVSYQITMQFRELEPIFNDDYGNDPIFPTEIGY